MWLQWCIYKHVKGIITVAANIAAKTAVRNNKEVIIKNFSLFTNYVRKKNKIQ